MTSLFFIDWNTEAQTQRVTAPELATTMARLEINVGTKRPTIVEEISNGSIRRSINVSLYPLAEWIVFNWWILLYSGRFAGTRSGVFSPRGENRRNNMRAAGDGFIWPNLAIYPEGGMIRIEWGSDRESLSGRGIRYLTNGSELVDFEWIRTSFAGLVEAILARLDEARVGETPLHKEWQALRVLQSDEVEFCEASGRLGLDPFSDGVDLATNIENACHEIDSALVAEFFDAANPDRLTENAHWVAEATQRVRTLPPSRTTFGLRREQLATEHVTANVGQRPYEIGYTQARTVRDLLGLSPSQFLQDNELLTESVIIESHEATLLGLGRVYDGHAKLVIGWNAHTEARRFIQARALWHVLYERTDAPFLLTSAQSQPQQTARAFAAELLAPADGIKARLGPGRGQIAATPMIADAYGVSDTVIERQIDNQL